MNTTNLEMIIKQAKAGKLSADYLPDMARALFELRAMLEFIPEEEAIQLNQRMHLAGIRLIEAQNAIETAYALYQTLPSQATPEEPDHQHSKTWYYRINLDERGDFQADVSDEDDCEEVYSISSAEDMYQLIEDGFMSDGGDVDGLESYLRELGIIGPTDIIIERE